MIVPSSFHSALWLRWNRKLRASCATSASKHDLERALLKRPERPFGVASQVELGVALEGLLEHPGIAHPVEQPEPRGSSARSVGPTRNALLP